MKQVFPKLYIPTGAGICASEDVVESTCSSTKLVTNAGEKTFVDFLSQVPTSHKYKSHSYLAGSDGRQIPEPCYPTKETMDLQIHPESPTSVSCSTFQLEQVLLERAVDTKQSFRATRCHSHSYRGTAWHQTNVGWNVRAIPSMAVVGQYQCVLVRRQTLDDSKSHHT